MQEQFISLGLDLSLIKALKIENITIPTDVQTRAIPQISSGIDVIMQSATSTGKTLAYLLPLFEKIKVPSKELQAIIIAPTHELVIQIQRQIESLSKNSQVSILSFPIIGSANIARQIENLKKKPQIVVGTPGRILELIQKKKMKAHTVQTVIIDEADRLMDINNIEVVQGIIKYLLKDRQLIIVSATMPDAIIDAAKKIMRDPVLIKSEGQQRIPEQIYHIYLTTEQRDKIETLIKLIKNINPEKAIVFINSVGQIDNLAGKLKYSRIKTESLHGSIQKKDRKKVMDDFRSGKINVLVASDIAARGLQMPGIPIVFNVDIPENSNDYLHRAGRTGRNSQEGVVISLVTDYELQSLKKIEKDLKIHIEKKVYYKGRIIDDYPDYKKRS